MASFTIKGNQISKMLKAIGAKNRAWELDSNKDVIKGYRIAVLNNKLMVWGNDEDNMQTLDIDAPGVKFSIFIDATASRLFGLIGKNTIEVSYDDEAGKLHLVETLDSGTAKMSIVVASKAHPVEPATEDAGVDESDDVEPVTITENTEAQPKTLNKKARETKFAPGVSAVDSDEPYHYTEAGPYTITTHDKVMVFRFSAHAEEEANYLAHTGELVSLDWDYTPLRVYDIVRVYENPTRWVVIDIVLNEYNLVNYVLRSEDGQTSPYYGFSIVRDFDKPLDNSCITMIQCSHHKNTGESPAHPEEDIMNNQTYTITIKHTRTTRKGDEHSWLSTHPFNNRDEAEQYADHVYQINHEPNISLDWDYEPIRWDDIVYIDGQACTVKSIFLCDDYRTIKYQVNYNDEWQTVTRDAFTRNAPTDPTPSDEELVKIQSLDWTGYKAINIIPSIETAWSVTRVHEDLPGFRAIATVFVPPQNIQWYEDEEGAWCEALISVAMRDELSKAMRIKFAQEAPTSDETDPTPADELESSDALDKYESELCECGFTLIPEHKLDALDYLETRYDINYTKWTLGRYWTVTSVHGPLPRYEEPVLKPFGYNDIADVMDNRLKNLFTITTDLFGGNGDELVTIPELGEMLDRDMYDGWQLFIDDTRDGELRLYAERVTDDIEDTTPSRYSDWVAVDGGFCYMTIGRRA